MELCGCTHVAAQHYAEEDWGKAVSGYSGTNPKQDVNNVSVVARRFLSAPSTSVASERMFSGAGNIYSDSRSRLSPERTEMLLFIKYNFRLCH